MGSVLSTVPDDELPPPANGNALCVQKNIKISTQIENYGIYFFGRFCLSILYQIY